MSFDNKYTIIFMILMHLLAFSETKCYNYWKGETFVFSHNNSYCHDLIKWPVSDQVLNDSFNRDNRALQIYNYTYLNQYKMNIIDKKCLGVIQYMACAVSYPTCADESQQIQSVCSFLCQIMKNRCGTSTKLYKDACQIGKIDQKNCSSEISLICISIFLMILILLL